MEPHSTSKPVTVPIVAACRAVSTTVSVLRASCERRRRPAKGRRSASASRRPGPASVSRSSTSRGGKGACLNGVAAAAAAMETEHAKAIGRQNLRGGNGAQSVRGGRAAKMKPHLLILSCLIFDRTFAAWHARLVHPARAPTRSPGQDRACMCAVHPAPRLTGCMLRP